ncbi:hypothetical protein MTR_8g042430 [Medicago truncatula]|uniref:Uncharacterized protein n=1 Tax=Medicago truncatula TaxID=3880 RepID=A0A072U063_MEDTR|nr:hypothetical protein MTR_8g042430 [Medicago truncatula]
MEYVLPNQRILPSTRCTRKEKTESQTYVKSKQTEKPKQKQRRELHMGCSGMERQILEELQRNLAIILEDEEEEISRAAKDLESIMCSFWAS